jgi:hypothetical protein
VLRAQPEALERPVRLQLVLKAQRPRALALLRVPELRLVLACWPRELQPRVPVERQLELLEPQKR